MIRKRVHVDIDEAIRLFKECPSWRFISRQLGVHPFIIQRKLEKLGYRVERSAGRLRKWDVKTGKELRKMKLTYEQIGELLGVDASTVQRGLKDEV